MESSKPVTGHKHAKLMLLYAQDAMTNPKPWRLWEAQLGEQGQGSWDDLVKHPIWHEGTEYRRKLVARHHYCYLYNGSWQVTSEGYTFEEFLQDYPHITQYQKIELSLTYEQLMCDCGGIGRHTRLKILR